MLRILTADMFPPGLALVGFLDPLWKLLMAEAQANIRIMNKCNSSGMPMKFLHEVFSWAVCNTSQHVAVCYRMRGLLADASKRWGQPGEDSWAPEMPRSH